MLKLAVLSLLLLAVSGQVTTGNTQSLQALSAASNTFSQNLYQQTATGNESLVYSPYSIHSALTLSYYGARGETADEMAQTLALTSFLDSSPHQAYHDLIHHMSSEPGVQLNSANAIFMNPNYAIEQDFRDEVSRDYYGFAGNFDLAAAEGPEKAINTYVEGETEGMIQDILPPNSIDGNTVMILINSIFFNGTWESKFDKFKTHPGDFQQLGGSKSQVDMMSDIKTLKLKRDNTNEVDVVELPFLNPRFALYIALPQKPEGLASVESTLTQVGHLNELFTDMHLTKMELKVPKFKIESSVKLNDALKNLGMVKAFDQTQADFTGITPETGVYISDVLHKAVIEVQESGTVAAAATSIEFAVKSFQLPPPDSFIADHPFLFFLRDNETQEILFQGRFMG